MRTTLSIDDDVLSAARDRARREGRSVGEVLSELVRASLQRRSSEPGTVRNGFHVLPCRGGIVTPELIDHIRDDEHI